MTFFERELRRMFEDTDIIQEPKISGKTLLGKLDDDLRIKLSFVTTGVAKHYDAIKLSIINRTDGLVDSEVFKFGDIIGEQRLNDGSKINPYIWDYDGTLDWYQAISISDKAQIADTILDYAEMYQGESQSAGMTM